MIKMSISGVSEIQTALDQFVPETAAKLMNNTVRTLAVEFKDEIELRAPDHRSLNLKRSIKVKKRRNEHNLPMFSVVFDAGKRAKHSGFYWRFIEHGTNKIAAKPFVNPAIMSVNKTLDERITRIFSKKLEQTVKRQFNKLKKKRKK